MYGHISTLALLFAMTMSNNACIAGSAAVEVGDAQAAQAAAPRQDFIPVEGADLKSKLDAAVRQGRAASKPSPFWVAYTFDVRPGIAIDPDFDQFNGNMNSFGGTTVFTGTVNGVRVE